MRFSSPSRIPKWHLKTHIYSRHSQGYIFIRLNSTLVIHVTTPFLSQLNTRKCAHARSHHHLPHQQEHPQHFFGLPTTTVIYVLLIDANGRSPKKRRKHTHTHTHTTDRKIAHIIKEIVSRQIQSHLFGRTLYRWNTIKRMLAILAIGPQHRFYMLRVDCCRVFVVVVTIYWQMALNAKLKKYY